MISNSNTNLNLSFHPPSASFSYLDLSCSLPPLPPLPIHMQPSTFNCHTQTHFFRFYRKAWANKKVFSCDLN